MSARWEAVWSVLDGWERLLLAAFILGAFGQTMFTIIYATRPWYRVRPGRATFFKAVGYALILDLTVLNTFLVYPYQEQVSAGAVVLATWTIFYQLYALLLSPRNPNA